MTMIACRVSTEDDADIHQWARLTADAFSQLPPYVRHRLGHGGYMRMRVGLGVVPDFIEFEVRDDKRSAFCSVNRRFFERDADRTARETAQQLAEELVRR